MNTLTGITKLAVHCALLGGLGAAAIGIGSGLAQADTRPGTTTTVHQTVRQYGDQDVVRRGTVIPIHGDDSRLSASHLGK